MTSSPELQYLPKAHLHIHLEGAMRPATLAELCRKYGIQRPVDTRGKRFANFIGFNEVYRAACDCIRTRDDLSRVIFEVAEDAAHQGVFWIEPAFDAERYSTLREDNPYRLFDTQMEGWRFALSAAEKASQATGVGIGYISAVDRTRPPEQGLKRARVTAELAHSKEHLIQSGMECFDGKHPGIVAFGLHGNEEGNPPELFEQVFQLALADTDLLSTPHAGEIAPFPGQGVASVASAVNCLGANRVQHGVLAFKDKELLEQLAREGVCLDVCPSSNIQLSVFPTIETHPLPEILRAGVPCSIGSDDPLLFGPNLLDEYELCRNQMGLSDELIATLARNSFLHSGAPQEVKSAGIAAVDKWLNTGS